MAMNELQRIVAIAVRSERKGLRRPAGACSRTSGSRRSGRTEATPGSGTGNAEFILQDFANEAFASNLMILIRVSDLDRWWEAVSRKRLEETYPGFRIKPPTDFPWGREIHFIDPAGVCWHVTAG